MPFLFCWCPVVPLELRRASTALGVLTCACGRFARLCVRMVGCLRGFCGQAVVDNRSSWDVEAGVFDAAMAVVAVASVFDAASRRHAPVLSPHPSRTILSMKTVLSVLLVACPIAGLVDDARRGSTVLIGDKVILLLSFVVLAGTQWFVARRGYARGLLVTAGWTLALLVGLARLVNSSSDSGTRQV